VRVCAEVDAALEAISVGGELRGLLRVAVPSTFGPTHFAPAIAGLTRRHPQLQINGRSVDLVTEGFDCGIRVGYPAVSNRLARRIGSFSVAPEDVPGHPAVMIGTETRSFSAAGEAFPVRPTGRFRADSAVTIAQVYGLPAVITTSGSDGPNGPIMPVVAKSALSKATGREKLPIAGISTDVCVAFAALSAKDAGYDFYAVVDASGTWSKRVEDAAITRMVQAGIVPINGVAVGAELLARWQSATGAAYARLTGDHLPFAGNTYAGFLAAKGQA
jgi:Isochorismatase family/LysR substrate binding domain